MGITLTGAERLALRKDTSLFEAASNRHLDDVLDDLQSQIDALPASNSIVADMLYEDLQDALPAVTISAGDEIADKRIFSIQLTDADGNALAARALVRVWISDADYGAPDATGNTVTIDTGTEYAEELANAAYRVISNAAGLIEVGVAISGAASRYCLAEIEGLVVSSGQITWAA